MFFQSIYHILTSKIRKNCLAIWFTETTVCSTVNYSWIIPADFCLSLHLSFLLHTSITLVNCLNSLRPSWCLVLIDPKLHRLIKCKLLPPWTVRTRLIPVIIVGNKSNQTNTTKLQELFKDQVQTPCESKNTFSVRTRCGISKKKVDRFNLKNWNSITCCLLWWKFLTIMPRLILFRLYLHFNLILGWYENDLNFQMKLWV